MIKGVFRRVFGTFYEGSILHAKFVVSAGPVFALKSLTGGANYQLTLVKNATAGRLTLTLPGGCRQLALLGAQHVAVSNPGALASVLDIFPRGAPFVEGTGVLDLITVQVLAAAVQDAAATDELHFTLYVGK